MTDVGKENDIRELVNQTIKAFGRLDVMVGVFVLPNRLSIGWPIIAIPPV